MFKTRPEVKEIIKEYRAALVAQGINVQRVILYGSFVNGKRRADSDIDLVIISSDFREMNLRQRMEILGIAAARIMKPIEAKGYTSEEARAARRTGFLKEILSAGVSI